MIESKFGRRDSRGNYKPYKRVGYPPIFIWPVQPLAAVKWIMSIPGYFLPWNTLYVSIGLIAWFFLSPPLESYANPSIKLTLLIFLRNSFLVTLYFGAFHYRLYIKRAQNTEYKFNLRWPSKNSKQFMFNNQNIDNIILTFFSGVTTWTAFELGILWVAANNFIEVISIDQNIFYFISMIFLIHFWRDLHFYVIHRLIHFQPLYSIAHRIHHKNTNPGPWSGLAMHPIEHLFYFSCVLAYLIFPFHPAFVIITLVHAGLSPAPGHAGFDRINFRNGKSFDADSYAHYLHHKYFECNYADGILPLDQWFGTLHDGSKEAHERLRKRLKEKSRLKIKNR
ncbi:MAG: sterol desaturase family protein [Paracoccaceae bacterium]|nr:sterol desaturase family protein [Paracoccaceae bacterium]